MRTNSTDIADFYRQISLLLKSGLPLPDSIHQLGENFEKKDFKEVLLALSDDTGKGETLANAIKKHPNYFTDFQIRMIEAGEDSGMLPETLSEIAMTSHLNLQLTSMVREIAIYPVFAIGFAFTVLFSLISILIPQFRDIFEDMLGGEPLPWLTEKVMNSTSIFVECQTFWISVIIVYILFFIWLFFGGLLAKRIFIKIISVIPGAGRIFYNLTMAKLCSIWSILLRQKIPSEEALRIISSFIESNRASSALKRISKEILIGTDLVESIENEKVISGMISLAVRHVPEKNLPDELGNLAILFRERASTATRKAGVIWGFVMMFMLAGIVGIIVLSLFLPLISIIKKLEGG